MVLQIFDAVIMSDLTGDRAVQLDTDRWLVSWLLGRSLSREQAITAMALAETAVRMMQQAAPGAVVDYRHPHWPDIERSARSLGLAGAEAMTRIAEAQGYWADS